MNNRQPFSAPKITALNSRLSRDDEMKGDSLSIANQKLMLEDCARQYGLTNIHHYIDDGISGSRFDRPDFVRMMEDIEAGKVAVVLTKDVSRIGRDHIRVGFYMETLRQLGVRLIAPGDGYDSDKGEDDFLPFKNIIHEFYARHTSRKNKAVIHAKVRNGKHMTNSALYGYKKSLEDKDQWLIDEEAAQVVRRIFQMTIDGKGTYQIARALTDDKIMRPSAYIALRDGYEMPSPEDKYRWNGRTVENILDHPEYKGSTVNFGRTRILIKTKGKNPARKRSGSYSRVHRSLLLILKRGKPHRNAEKSSGAGTPPANQTR